MLACEIEIFLTCEFRACLHANFHLRCVHYGQILRACLDAWWIEVKWSEATNQERIKYKRLWWYFVFSCLVWNLFDFLYKKVEFFCLLVEKGGCFFDFFLKRWWEFWKCVLLIWPIVFSYLDSLHLSLTS